MVADPIKPTRQELSSVIPQADYRFLRALERLFERAGEETPSNIDGIENRIDILDALSQSLINEPERDLSLPEFIRMVQPLPVTGDDFPKPLERLPLAPSAYAAFSMAGNVTATTFTAINTPTKALGTTTAGPSLKFLVGVNQITLEEPSGPVSVSVSFGLAGTAAEQILVSIAVNDTPVTIMPALLNASGDAYGSIQAVVELSVGDDVEIFLANGTSTNSVTLTQTNLIAKEL